MAMRIKSTTRFTELLAEQDLNQSELARRVVLSRSFLSEVVSGRKRIDDYDAALIACELGVDLSTLFVRAPRPARKRRRGDAAEAAR